MASAVAEPLPRSPEQDAGVETFADVLPGFALSVRECLEESE